MPSHLFFGPGFPGLYGVTPHEDVEKTPLIGISGPPFLEVLFSDVCDSDLPALTDGGSHRPVCFHAFLPIEKVSLGRSNNSATYRGFDEELLGPIGVGNMSDGEGTVGDFESLADDPAYALA